MSQAAEGLQFLAMAGFSVDEQIGALPAVLNAAQAAGITLGESADVVSNIMTGFGISADESGKAVDVLVKTMTTANTNLPQLGQAMKYVAPVAASLGLSIEETAAAVAKMSDAGIQGSQAGTSLRQALLSLANPVGQTEEAINGLGIEVNTTEGKMKPLPELIGHIAGKLDGMTDAQKVATAAQLVGTESASGFLALLKVGEDGLADYTAELENSAGAADNMATKMTDNLIGSFKEFQSALEEIGISVGNEFLPAFREIVDAGAAVVRKLTEIEGSTIASTLAFAGVASGVAFLGATVGRILPLLRTFSFMMGPAGILIGGLSIIAGLTAAHSLKVEENTEQTLKNIDAKFKETQELEKLTTRYDELKGKLELSNGELGRYLDINSEIARTSNPDVITRLKDEQDKLRENSGLTNDELNEFLGINDKIIDKVPDANVVLSEQGNVMLDSADAAKELTKARYEEIKLDLENARYKLLGEVNAKYKERKDIQQKLNDLLSVRQGMLDELKEKQDKVAESEKAVEDALLTKNEIKIAAAERQLEADEVHLENLYESLSVNGDLVKEQEDELAKIDKKIGKLDEANKKLVDLELLQHDITAAKGEEIKAIEEAIQKEKLKKQTLENQTPVNQKNTEEYRKASKAIDDNIAGLQRTREKIRGIIDTASEMNSSLSKPISKEVRIQVTEQYGAKTYSQARRAYEGLGGKYHSGGIIGRGQMPKLHVGGLVSQFANAPLHNEMDVRLLRNEMVLTESQQANLMRWIDAGQTPGKQEAVTTERDINRLIAAIYDSGDRPIYFSINGREFARAVHEDITEEQARKERTDARGRGRLL
jgi:TP901 family phage tail tape measure protein